MSEGAEAGTGSGIEGQARGPTAGRRRLFLALWAATCVASVAVCLEFTARWVLPDARGLDRRTLEPYFMTGLFRDNQPGSDHPEIGPEAYGYIDRGSVFTFDFESSVPDVAARGARLFPEREAPKPAEAARELGAAGGTGSAGARPPVRLYVIGGSVAQGCCVRKPEDAWAPRLERMLAARLGRPVAVTNAAMASYVSTQERVVQALTVLPRCPDAVVILDGFNDFYNGLVGARPGDPYNQGVLYKTVYSPWFNLAKRLAESSRLARFALDRSIDRALEEHGRWLEADPRRADRYVESAASVYLDNLAQMRRLCEAYGVPCRAFLQPASALSRARLLGPQRAGLAFHEKLIIRSYEEVLARREELAREGMPLVDLTRVLDGRGGPQAFADEVHPREDGHLALAEAILPQALEMIQAPPAAARQRCLRR